MVRMGLEWVAFSQWFEWVGSNAVAVVVWLASKF